MPFQTMFRSPMSRAYFIKFSWLPLFVSAPWPRPKSPGICSRRADQSFATPGTIDRCPPRLRAPKRRSLAKQRAAFPFRAERRDLLRTRGYPPMRGEEGSRPRYPIVRKNGEQKSFLSDRWVPKNGLASCAPCSFGSARMGAPAPLPH